MPRPEIFSARAELTVLTLQRGVLPPTINQRTPDPECELDYVPNHARERRVQTAMSPSFGSGGTNAVLVLSKPRRVQPGQIRESKGRVGARPCRVAARVGPALSCTAGRGGRRPEGRLS
jgi:acyl transferase domain-containing protein